MANTKPNTKFFQLVIDRDLMDDFAIAVRQEKKEKREEINMTSKITDLITDYLKERG